MPCKRPSGLCATDSGIDDVMGGLSGKLASPLLGRRMCCVRLATDGGIGRSPGKRDNGPDRADRPGRRWNGIEANPGGQLKPGGGGIDDAEEQAPNGPTVLLLVVVGKGTRPVDALDIELLLRSEAVSCCCCCGCCCCCCCC